MVGVLVKTADREDGVGGAVVAPSAGVGIDNPVDAEGGEVLCPGRIFEFGGEAVGIAEVGEVFEAIGAIRVARGEADLGPEGDVGAAP